MKIKSKLVVMMVSLVLIVLFTASFISINAFSTGMITEIIKHSEDTAVQMIDKINGVMSERISDVKALTASDNNFLSSPNITLQKKMGYLMEFEGIKGVYGSISIYDFNGIKIGDTKNIGVGQNRSNEEFFRIAVQGNVYYDKIPVWSNDLKEYVIFLSGPIRDDSGKVTGALVLRYPIKNINNIIRSDLPKDSVGINLVTNNGSIIYSNYENKTVSNSSLSDLPMYNKIKNSNEMVVSGIYPDVTGRAGDAIFVAAKQKDPDKNGIPWFLITSLNTQDAFSEMLKLREQFIIVTVAVVAASIIAVFFLARTISRPLTTLKNAAESIARGNLNLKINTNTEDEIGELAHQFMKMQESIKKRTKDLQKTNMQLLIKEKLIEESYQELLNVDKAKEEFVSMVSHELKTPLVPIKLYLDMILKTNSLGDLNEKQYKALDTIHRSVQKLELLVSDVLDVFKMDLGALKLSKRNIEISSLMNEVIAELKPFTVHKQIELGSDVKVSGTINCDRQRIEQVFSNLVKNSIDFVPDTNGKIILRVEQDENDISKAIFTVEDNGIGIPPDKVDNLFKKFYQIDTSATRR
ncbi:MAG: sensor histidine kinase, partial [Thermoproteota archaeon]|nr:sensor histidine kinase [Thermoproteota archaeon]